MATNQETARDRLPNLWMFICRLWCFFAVIILILVIVGEGIVMNNSITRYHDYYGSSFPSNGYDQDPSGANSGYVALTNVPKHVGSLVWAASFETAIIVFCAFLAFGDAAMAYNVGNNAANNGMVSMKGTHLAYNQQYNQEYFARPLPNGLASGQVRQPFFVIGLAFLKVFVSVAYLSQSLYGISDGRNGNNGILQNRSLYARSDGYWEGGVYHDGNQSGGTSYVYSSGDNSGQNYSNGSNNGNGTDVQTFCLVVGFVLLGSVPFTVIAQAFTYITQVNTARMIGP